MKKIITISIYSLLTTLIFSSCSHTLIKRHYNKGYYVESQKSSKTEKPKNQQKEYSKAFSETKNMESFEPITKKSSTLNFNNDSLNIKAVVKGENLINKNTKTEKIKYKNKNLSNDFLYASKSNLSDNEIQKSVSKGNDDDGLSLFWIIILVVLLLWIFGYVFLANALINILLIVALILLILWLLRII